MNITITDEEAKIILPIIEEKRKEAAQARVIERLSNEIKESIQYLAELTNTSTAKHTIRQILKEL